MPTIPVKAEITGSVWKIEVQPGDAVSEDDAVVILESMKMEIPVVAPRGGTIVEILVEQGATVTEGQAVATMEV